MLMISEVALSFVVLGSALLLMRSFTTLAWISHQFSPTYSWVCVGHSYRSTDLR
jgi:hypothetical protein